MQPMIKTLIGLVELTRQVMSDFMNSGMDKNFNLDLYIHDGADKIIIEGDNALFTPMFENLIQNSISHNPDGCNISITDRADEAICTLKVEDTGSGV